MKFRRYFNVFVHKTLKGRNDERKSEKTQKRAKKVLTKGRRCGNIIKLRKTGRTTGTSREAVGAKTVYMYRLFR